MTTYVIRMLQIMIKDDVFEKYNNNEKKNKLNLNEKIEG